MADEPRAGSENLQPWKPGESGNPAGSSQRARSRAVAKRIGGLAPAIREQLDSAPPASLLAELSPEQQAALDGSETLAQLLGAKLLAAAASATTLNQLLSALALVAQIDAKTGAMLGGATPLDEMLARFPRHLRHPLEAAFEAFQNGKDPWWAFESHLRASLDEEQRHRLLRAVMGTADLRNFPPKELARFTDALPEDDREHLTRIHDAIERAIVDAIESLSDDDREHLDRIQTALRTAPIEEEIERELH